MLNADEYNFINGYLCLVEENDTELTPLAISNKFDGKPRCNDWPPQIP